MEIHEAKIKNYLPSSTPTLSISTHQKGNFFNSFLYILWNDIILKRLLFTASFSS